MTWGDLAGAGDTVMDLPPVTTSTPRASGSAQQPGPDRHGPDLSGLREGRRARRRPDVEVFRDTVIEQAEQGVDYMTITRGSGCGMCR